MTTLAIIPARGGSKGIPRKNLQPLLGKPLICWTIEQALASRTAQPDLLVVVSTEDDEIATVAEHAGARVVPRPADLAHDTTATEPVVLHTIEVLAAEGIDPETTMLLQATSPVRKPGTVERALSQFATTGVDSLVGVVPCPPFLWSISGDGETVAHWDWRTRARRQDLSRDQVRYRETGSLYVTRTALYRESANRLGGSIGLFIMDEDEGVDIDTLHDLAIATAMMERDA